MSDYQELLEATIAHLRDLKRQGSRYVPLSEQSLAILAGKTAPAPAAPLPRPVVKSDPAPALPTAPQVAPPPAVVVLKPQVSPPPIITNSGNEKSEKAIAMGELRARALVCVKCPHLANSRNSVVFGVGNIDAEIMFVGEAPGADEDLEAEPFVGRAGQLLTKIIGAMGLNRESVYIANILKCRPDTPGQSYGNRPPTPDEMKNCLPYLNAQIELIKPKAIVALGATAHDGLFGKVAGLGISKLRGRFKLYRGIQVMPTFHPSYLLRPQIGNAKREVWEDMMKVMETLEMPISEKQRGYFLNKA